MIVPLIQTQEDPLPIFLVKEATKYSTISIDTTKLDAILLSFYANLAKTIQMRMIMSQESREYRKVED